MNSKWRNLNIKTKTVTILEEIINLYDILLGNDLLEIITKAGKKEPKIIRLSQN